MPYNASKPAPSDLLSNSVTDIQGNFAQASTSFGINHFPFTDNSPNLGKHTYVDMVNQAKPTTAANEGAIYTKQATSVGASMESNIFYTPDASGLEYQLTRTITANIATFGASTGWTFLPGGILMQWGLVPGPSSANTIAVAFPVTYTSNVFSLSVIPIRAASSPGDDTTTVIVTGTGLTGGFTIGNVGSHTMQGWYWMAIGK